MTRVRKFVIALLYVAGLQMTVSSLTDHYFGSRTLHSLFGSISILTGASPFWPLFDGSDDFEHFSMTLEFRTQDESGHWSTHPFVPATQAQRGGPVNRRNIWGGAFIDGPFALREGQEDVLQAVANQALCGERAFLREIGFDVSKVEKVRLVWRPEEFEVPPDMPLKMEVHCE